MSSRGATPFRSKREHPMSSSISPKSSDADLLQKKDVSHVVRRILVQQSIDKPVSANDDLREIGLTSLDMVDLVLSVESEFNVRIPEAAITPANFRSIATIDALIKSLSNGGCSNAAGCRRRERADESATRCAICPVGLGW